MGQRRNDIILIAALAAAGALIAFAVFLMSGRGAQVRVSVDGEIVKTMPLSEDAECEIAGVGGFNRLVIEGGEAYLSEADCPDHLCVKMGEICKSGQSIICLPHKVVVTVVGGDEEMPVDVVVE